ncbi:MAG TPA: VOC family protein [Xanthobacteraceae bacterium]
MIAGVGVAITSSSRRQKNGKVPWDSSRSQEKAQGVDHGSKTYSGWLSHRDALSHGAGRDQGHRVLKQAFGAELSHEPIKRPDGSIMHAQVTIGDSRIMIAEESEMAKATSSTLYLYVPDADETYKRAVKAGGHSIMEPMDMFYGDRGGGVKDPSGNSWFVATHKEDVAPAELAKRAEAFNKQQKGKAA